jgi:hypothetical protein
MRLASFRSATWAGVLAIVCVSMPTTAFAGRVYWLWAGVPAPDDADEADILYLHQGHIQASSAGGSSLTDLGMAPHPAKFRSIALVYRCADLPDPRHLAEPILVRIHAWERHGVPVAGVQIDFDAATLKLRRYAEFLRGLRAILPRRYALSITGLADWGTTAPTPDLEAVASLVDEINFQLYRGRKPVPEWEAYARSLVDLKSPFRIGLLTTMTLPPALERALSGNPFYRGPSYFLLKGTKHD